MASSSANCFVANLEHRALPQPVSGVMVTKGDWLLEREEHCLSQPVSGVMVAKGAWLLRREEDCTLVVQPWIIKRVVVRVQAVRSFVPTVCNLQCLDAICSMNR
jgi:hypothetical protein